jgi:hypothetical protein
MTCVFKGTYEPDEVAGPKVARASMRNGRLAAELRQAKRQYDSFGGDRVTVRDPDFARIVPPLVKNAKGHFYFEMGQAPEGEVVISVLLPFKARPINSVAASRPHQSAKAGQRWAHAFSIRHCRAQTCMMLRSWCRTPFISTRSMSFISCGWYCENI